MGQMPLSTRKSPTLAADAVKKTAAATVLVVDDEPLIRWSLKERLLDAGYSVADAPDGRGALKYFTLDAPAIDAVLLDLRLPDADGLSVLDRIKLAAPDIPVILMTAYGSPETLSAAAEHGAAMTVNKPFGIDEMVGFVDRVLHAPILAITHGGADDSRRR